MDYIQRLKASEGVAFVSSTQEWKRRALSPATGGPGMPAGARPHATGQPANPYGSSPPQGTLPPYGGRPMPPVAAGYGGAGGYGQQAAGCGPSIGSPERRPPSPRVSNGWAPRQPTLQQVMCYGGSSR